MRKGQIISNFIEYLKTKGIHDIFYMTDKEWEIHMSEYKRLLKLKNNAIIKE